jgi:hypothetical protein
MYIVRKIRIRDNGREAVLRKKTTDYHKNGTDRQKDLKLAKP